jgi:hypothetical protein
VTAVQTDDRRRDRPTSDAGVLLTVVVTIVEGREAVRRVLRALTTQETPPALEILVPFDQSVREVATLEAEFPSVRFLALGDVSTELPLSSAGGEHELFDRRRAAGLKIARGDLIAIIEDRGAPVADWARTVVALHAEMSHAVIGGAIDPLPSSLLQWAIHVCDFTRYTSPFDGGPRDWVSDVNVSYKRSALQQTEALWRERYQEPVVHWALQQAGETLYLSPALRVEHRRAPVPLGQLMSERFHWGRLFGAIRGRRMDPLRRMVLACATPLIPLVVLVRHGRAQAAKGQGLRFLRASPAVLALLFVWTAGEITGVVTRRT